MKNLKSVILFSILLLIPVGIQNSYAGVGGDTFIGEIKWFGGNFAPSGFAKCDGQLLPIAQNTALFSVLGTTYGPDGETTFGLPDMRGRMPMHSGTGPGLTPRSLGAEGGAEAVTLAPNHLPPHTHALKASSALGESTDPQGNVLHTGQHPFLHRMYRGGGTLINMHADSIAPTGGEAHNNLPPFLNINCLISLFGTFVGGSPFIGEIRWVGFNSAPSGWAKCDGQLLAIDQNQSLFEILGNTYGGDGETFFALPDMRGRMPMHDTNTLGQKAGLESASISQSPSHTHQLRGTMASGDDRDPTNRLLATGTHPYAQRIYQSSSPDLIMDTKAIMATGGGQAHFNMSPFLALNCIIAISGTFPSSDGGGGGAFIGEIKWFGGNFAPLGFEKCNGQLKSIAQNTSLFSIFGTTYGGDGETTFGLPNLVERIIMHPGTGPGLSPRQLGQSGGTSTVTLTEAQLGAHTHTLKAFSELGDSTNPEGNLLATGNHPNYHEIYSNLGTRTDMHGSAISTNGVNQGHENLPPHLKITCLVALIGDFPSLP